MAYSINPVTDAEIPLLLTMLVDATTERGRPTDVTATRQSYADALSSNLAQAIIAFIDGQAAGFALFSWSFLPETGKPALSILELYSSTALPDRSKLDRALFSACCALAADRRAGAVEWRVKESDQRAIAASERIGARLVKSASMVVEGEQDVAMAARVTDQ